jgi:hypothetical protein
VKGCDTLTAAVRSQPGKRKGDRMGGFTFRLEHEDGTPAEPRKFDAAVPNWRPGDTIHLGPGKVLRVVAIRDDDADQPPRLVVEDMSGPAAGDRAA